MSADLNQHWIRPVRTSQATLFPQDRDTLLAWVHVSLEETDRWSTNGWLSLDLRNSAEIDEPGQHELLFVRNVVRPGLTDAQIEALLPELEFPYAYDPNRTAYSFSHGWVQAPAKPGDVEVFEIVEEHLSEWLEALARNGNKDKLMDVAGQVFDLMKAHGLLGSDE